MARKAVEAFRAQTYDPASRYLLIYDTGDQTWYDPESDSENEVHLVISGDIAKGSIGSLRNKANACVNVDVLIHWDSDDWSHPQRIVEQVAFLQSSGADCVAYRELLFWRDTEAWRYKTGAPSCGSTFCYWRKAWEKHPFPDVSHGEDVLWRPHVRIVGRSALLVPIPQAEHKDGVWQDLSMECEPRMICRIHGGNTETYEPAQYPDTWTRVPQFDEYCRAKMAL